MPKRILGSGRGYRSRVSTGFHRWNANQYAFTGRFVKTSRWGSVEVSMHGNGCHFLPRVKARGDSGARERAHRVRDGLRLVEFEEPGHHVSQGKRARVLDRRSIGPWS